MHLVSNWFECLIVLGIWIAYWDAWRPIYHTSNVCRLSEIRWFIWLVAFVSKGKSFSIVRALTLLLRFSHAQDLVVIRLQQVSFDWFHHYSSRSSSPDRTDITNNRLLLSWGIQIVFEHTFDLSRIEQGINNPFEGLATSHHLNHKVFLMESMVDWDVFHEPLESSILRFDHQDIAIELEV